ncbi:Acyl-coenzyme A synthetase / AMP-(Fatty) acid ligase [metagenome]|uniref:Acyl-coenzyme A synthetase / AMP-(Fatty) acid ligase n=1 Tax=metagenome TaxID=256318 RepID=A0A2P2C3U2_9ZZZZ
MTSDTLQIRLSQVLAAFTAKDASAAWLFCDRHDPATTAFRFVDGSTLVEDVTFGDLRMRSLRVARALHDEGVRAGDRVASLMSKGSDLPAVLLGVWRLGAVYVPLFTAFAAETVHGRLVDAEVSAVVTDTGQRAKIREGSWRVLRANVRAGDDLGSDEIDLSAAMRHGAAYDGEGARGPQTPLVHMFTSGTTGKPKSVVHPLAYAAGWQCYLEFGLGVRDPDQAFWCAADPGWAYGLYTAIVGPLATGVPSVMSLKPFDPGSTWATLKSFDITDFAGAPTMLRAMRASPEIPAALPSLARVSSAGEPLTSDVNVWMSGLLGIQVHDHYGQTELGMPAGFAHHPAMDTGILEEAMGRAFPGWQLVVLDQAADVPAAAGRLGRLAVDVAASELMTFTGYGAERDQAAGRFTTDGRYYVTGDLVTVDANAVIHFGSRDDDVILMAGYRIGPFDIENVLLRHPAVVECAVVGMPDEVRGEVVCAFVVLSAASTGGEELVRELQAWVKENYAAHAYPRTVLVVSSLPKTESGKVQRAVLRRELTHGGSSS